TSRSKPFSTRWHPRNQGTKANDPTRVSYFGSPSAKAQIAADLGEHANDYTARKTILWESDTATDAEVRAMEAKLIRETRANDPAIGYNLWPRL
ncbi:hypothetical protein, partial [Mycobacterium sp. E802]|uniref:hypothetical protein n=1 Tax=Mycobacterium sp. E802 TaxID=1834152 RepID=UPI001E5E794B